MMGLVLDSILFISSLFIIGLGIFLLKHKDTKKSVVTYIKIVGSFCIFLGVMGIFYILFSEIF